MRLTLHRHLLVLGLTLGFLYNHAIEAAEAVIETKILRVLIQADDSLGGCMALLSVNPGSLLPSCADGWVTFSCSGQYTDSVRAYRMLDQAQLALATDRPVSVWFTDQAKHSGFCFANRIDIY